MAPKSGNSGGKNPHMTKRNRFNPNYNVPVSHPSCQVSARAKIDRDKHHKNGNPPQIRHSGARGMFHIEGNN